VAAYDDLEAVRAFARAVDVVTFEFENVPAATTAAAAEHAPVRPDGAVLHITQERLREKTFLLRAGLPLAPFAAVRSLGELQRGLQELGLPAVVKRSSWGYDGKGQVRVDAAEQAAAAWHGVGQQPSVLEAWIPFEAELSVIAARGLDGACAHFGVIENRHARQILDLSIAPARVPERTTREALELARAVLEKLHVVGVMCVEFFLLGDGRLLINELAPRPHNSGHLTLEAFATSQFEQQLRAVCGLPLGSTAQLQPAAMANLLGDLWNGGEPDWAAALALPGVGLHLYGKREPRPGRKMGHLTVLADTPDDAARLALQARAALTAHQSPK
jgi:5-(carboxyamino)imidazole ribonucleotide synthase